MSSNSTANKPKALQLASVASMIDLFNRENIKILKNLGYEVDVATNFEEGSITSQERVNDYRQELKDSGVKAYQVPIPRKISKLGDFVKSYKIVKKLSKENNYRIMHCHSPIGGVIARLAFSKARKRNTKVIYTAHGFHFYKGAPIKNWLLYFPAEWICSFMTDVLITINKEDYKFAKKHLHDKKAEYVPGVGIDIDKFRETEVDRKKMRKELGIPDNAKVLLSVGELSKRKNHEVVIKALVKIDDKSLHYIIVGNGKLDKYLINLSQSLGVRDKVHLLGYRRDIPQIMKCCDLFVFPSLQEGLPVALMEAMASGMSCIASDIRGNKDLLRKEQLFDPFNVEQIIKHIYLFFDKNHEYITDKNTMSKYSVSSINDKMKIIYENVN